MRCIMRKWIAAVMLVVLVAIDQITKYLAKAFLEGKESFVIIKNVLELQYLEGGNTGAAFGLFAGKTMILAIISLVVFFILLFVIYKFSKESKNFCLCISLVIMASGALGNCIDRFANQYVIDFIYLKCIDFPIFNVADCYVTVSAVVIFLMVAFAKDEERQLESNTQKRMEKNG